MLIFVLTCNSLIFIFNFYLFWQLIKLKRHLTQLANTLESLEKSVPIALQLIQLNVRRREYQSLTLRKKYEFLQQNRENLLTILQVLRWLYRKYQS
ncbi:hypothetical protein PCC7418_2070 [Halothece sp. PCC 7418]|nr:hypothetical protein PCC7418_2070 [Halothece sp. PCC 7418]